MLAVAYESSGCLASLPISGAPGGLSPMDHGARRDFMAATAGAAVLSPALPGIPRAR
jgi:hypothetical protein